MVPTAEFGSVRMLSGREFHADVPACEKARSPNMLQRDLAISNVSIRPSVRLSHAGQWSWGFYYRVSQDSSLWRQLSYQTTPENLARVSFERH